MAAKTTKNNVVTTTTTTYVDKTSLRIVLVTVFLILVVIITGICVRLLLDEYLSSIILIALICFLIVLGIVVLSVLATMRRKYSASETTNVVTLKNGRQYHGVSPTAPREEPSSWEYSNRTTVTA